MGGLKRKGAEKQRRKEACQERGNGYNFSVAENQSTSSENRELEICPIESAEPGEYWRWCPRCGHELHNEKCKLRCPRCQYFMSCSDFD